MKNKKNIRVLLPLVLIIWSVLIYKVVDAFSGDSPNMMPTTAVKLNKPVIQERDTFSLLAINSDPFLGTIYKKNTPKTITQKKKVEWMPIIYKGLMASGDGKNKVFLLSISGQEHLLVKGDTISGIKVVRGSADKIKLRYKGESKEFKRQ